MTSPPRGLKLDNAINTTIILLVEYLLAQSGSGFNRFTEEENRQMCILSYTMSVIIYLANVVPLQ